MCFIGPEKPLWGAVSQSGILILGKKTNHIARKLLTMLALSLSHDFGHSLQQRVQTTLNHFRFVNFSTAHTCTTVYMYSKPFGNKPESFLAVSSGVSLGFATLLSVMISTKLEGVEF